jgi:hypothetical protein
MKSQALLENSNQSILILHPKKYIRFFRAKQEPKIKPKKRSKLVYYPKSK